MTASTILGQLPTTLSIPHKAAIEGFLDYPGHVIVEGIVNGDVRCTSVTIKERGVVDGNIIAETVLVLGEVSGAIYANDLTLKMACSVAGDIFHQTLLLEDGCYFEGKSRRHAAPLSLAS
jgi:cytoskeletal protein CcmA (bactofilin family)